MSFVNVTCGCAAGACPAMRADDADTTMAQTAAAASATQAARELQKPALLAELITIPPFADRPESRPNAEFYACDF